MLPPSVYVCMHTVVLKRASAANAIAQFLLLLCLLGVLIIMQYASMHTGGYTYSSSSTMLAISTKLLVNVLIASRISYP